MSSFLTRTVNGAKRIDVRHSGGFLGHAVETGEYLGTSYLAGYLNTKYGDKLHYKGVDLTLAAGLVGKIGAVLADVFGVGVPGLAHINTVSTALIGAHLVSMGAEHGLDSASKVAPKPRPLPAPTPLTGNTSLGAIPPASGPGKWLDHGQVQALAQMHG